MYGVGQARARHLDDENYGIPTTTPARTLADCAPLLTERQLRRAVNQAQIAHLTQREALMEQPRLRALVNEHGATRSLLEDLLFALARHHGLPEPHLNREIHGVEVDFYYPDLLEAQGERVIPVTYAPGQAASRDRGAPADDHRRAGTATSGTVRR